MTLAEFSDKFDTLIDSYRRFTALDHQEAVDTLDFNEYEKSLFLTKAQKNLIVEFYSGRNSNYEGFEQTEEVRRYLDQLVNSASLSTEATAPSVKLDSKSKFFTLPNDHMFTIYESVTISSTDSCKNDKEMLCVPVTHDEYFRISKNPFRWAKGRALRLDVSNNIAEVICDDTINKYNIRYIKTPSPIVLVNLPNDLTIDGVATATECSLHPIFHDAILERATKLAISSRIYGSSK